MRSTTLSQVGKIIDPLNFYPSVSITGYCVDTRLLKPGDLFFSLPGSKVDGHQFIQEAVQRGAAAIVTSQSSSCAIPVIKVADPLRALQELAKVFLTKSHSRVVAVTGSQGKTTTKEFMQELLKPYFKVSASHGNYNSQIGLPLSILNHASGEEEILILEMGMTEKGHIRKLIEIAPPEIALVMGVSLVHACHFNGIEEIAAAKGEIFQCQNTRLRIYQKGCTSILHGIPFESDSAEKWTFSLTRPDSDFYYDDANHCIRFGKRSISLQNFKVPGRHNISNLMGAVAVAIYFEVCPQEIESQLVSLTLPSKRLEHVEKRGVLFVNDSYNAAEESVKAAIDSLPSPKGNGRKIGVLGSMLELGQFSEECHYNVGVHAFQHLDEFYCLGEECQPAVNYWLKAGKPARLFLERDELLDFLKGHLVARDVVLLKGSHSKEMWKLLDGFEV